MPDDKTCGAGVYSPGHYLLDIGTTAGKEAGLYKLPKGAGRVLYSIKIMFIYLWKLNQVIRDWGGWRPAVE